VFKELEGKIEEGCPRKRVFSLGAGGYLLEISPFLNLTISPKF